MSDYSFRVLVAWGAGNRLAWMLRRLADWIEGGRSLRIAITGNVSREERDAAFRYARVEIAREIAETLGELRRIDLLDASEVD